MEQLSWDNIKLDKCADSLLPVVVQDAVTLRVLMLGYMNREAFEKTQREGRVTFLAAPASSCGQRAKPRATTSWLTTCTLTAMPTPCSSRPIP